MAVSAAWPLILAIVLRRTRWPQLLPAAAATFLVLSIGGMIELSVQWGNARGYGGMVGSFHLNRRAFLSPTMSDLALGTLGAIQLLLELTVAVRAILLIPTFRSAPAEDVTRQEQARRARHGRIAVYTSLGFLFVVIRLPVWSTYLETAEQFDAGAQFHPRKRHAAKQLAANPCKPYASAHPRREAIQRLPFSDHALRPGCTQRPYTEARDRYQEAIDGIDSMPSDSLPAGSMPFLALALNNLAWLQATCPQIELRNARDAVRNARRDHDTAR